MKIVLFPSSKSNSNKYIDLINDALKANGFEVINFCLIKLITGKYRNVDYFNLNWFENAVSIKEFIKKMVIFFILQASRKKIIFVMHNKRVHANGQSFISLYYSEILFYLLFKFSYKIIIHSKDSIDYIEDKYLNKVVYIPHPNYIDVYGPIPPNNTISVSVLNLLFIGQIKEYKNIEVLIDVVSQFPQEEISLIIAGKVSPKEYENKLNKKIKSIKNIKPVFKFLEDKEIPLFLSKCDLLILPYDVKSSLNSGTIILAFSYKKTVISSEIGTLNDMNTKFYFSYEYKNESEHIAKLTAIINDAIEMKKENPFIFKEWGMKMYNDILQNNTIAIVGEKLKELYQEPNHQINIFKTL
jgi:glycosyltransferase involved in cell wall biosynthesis